MSITFTTVTVLLIGAIACVTDLRNRRIPNALTLGGALAGLAYQGLAHGADGLMSGAAGWLTGVAFFVLPFALGGLGAGDVKLVAALGAWLGPVPTVWLGLYSCVAGGVLALVVALARGYLRQACRNIWLLFAHWRVMGLTPLHEISLEGGHGPRLAYAIPILVGTMVTLWLH